MLQFPVDKSYYHCFSTINFTKPSWRILHTVVFFLWIPLLLWIGYKPSTRCGRVHFEHCLTVDYPWKIYRPATHPINFAADSPDKIHRCAAWAVFFFMGNVPWKFHKPTGRDTGSPVNAAAKQGQELRSGQTAIHIYEQWNSLLIFAS